LVPNSLYFISASPSGSRPSLDEFSLACRAVVHAVAICLSFDKLRMRAKFLPPRRGFVPSSNFPLILSLSKDQGPIPKCILARQVLHKQIAWQPGWWVCELMTALPQLGNSTGVEGTIVFLSNRVRQDHWVRGSN